MQGMEAKTAAQIISLSATNKDLVVKVLNKMDANKVANILAAKIDGFTGGVAFIISLDKSGEILAAMGNSKVGKILTAMKPTDAVHFAKAILDEAGVGKIAAVMKTMSASNVAKIMALRIERPGLGEGELSAKECAGILKAMGGIKTKGVRTILYRLYKLNHQKAKEVYHELTGKTRPYRGWSSLNH
jgi:flagellar motility protein MotE (MotC chaperone)